MNIKQNPIYIKLFSKFDQGFSSQMDKLNRTINIALESLDAKVKRCERKMESCCIQIKKKCDSDLLVAENLVNKELRSKVIMSQWTNKFLSETESISLDPITFAFARFSLNISLCYLDVNPQYFLQSKVHHQLIALSNFQNELVIGPAILGLAHLSLLHEMKPEIVSAGILPRLMTLMVESNSKLILLQCCKLIASLSLHFPNKSMIVNSGCLHGILDLILGSHKDTNKDIQYYALCSAVNIITGSDANRVLAVELKAIKPIITSIQTTSDNDVLLQAARALANIAYCNPYTSGCILSAGGDSVLLEVLESSDITRLPYIVHTTITALSNMCCSEGNQSHLGSVKGLLEAIVRIIEHARHNFVARSAASFLFALMCNNTANKAKVASKGACSALTKRIIRLGLSTSHDEESIACIEALTVALASMLLFKSNHDKMTDIGALDELVRICRKSSVARVVAAISAVIVAMVPSPDELFRYHDEEYGVPVEKAQALSVLKKARIVGFGHLVSPPEWLEKAVAILCMTDEALKRQPVWLKKEFEDKRITYEEFSSEIYPDTDVMASIDFNGLIFSIY